MMVTTPRCIECDAPVTEESAYPCWRCQRAWAWLIAEQDQDVIAEWDQAQDRLRGLTGGTIGPLLAGIRIVAWQNGVLTLAGWKRERRWFARRYTELVQAMFGTEKKVVFVTPRVGATMARKIKRDKEQR